MKHETFTMLKAREEDRDGDIVHFPWDFYVVDDHGLNFFRTAERRHKRRQLFIEQLSLEQSVGFVHKQREVMP
jgi:hypothetical protein